MNNKVKNHLLTVLVITVIAGIVLIMRSSVTAATIIMVPLGIFMVVGIYSVFYQVVKTWRDK